MKTVRWSSGKDRYEILQNDIRAYGSGLPEIITTFRRCPEGVVIYRKSFEDRTEAREEMME